jgi:hypothetical protein
MTANPIPADLLAARRDLLCRTGQALYGYHWQSAVARHLKTPVRTVQRWAAGEYLVPIGVLRDLVGHCSQRISEIEEMQAVLVDRLHEPSSRPHPEQNRHGTSGG